MPNINAQLQKKFENLTPRLYKDNRRPRKQIIDDVPIDAFLFQAPVIIEEKIIEEKPVENTIIIDGISYPTCVVNDWIYGGKKQIPLSSRFAGSCGARMIPDNTMPRDLLMGWTVLSHGRLPDMPPHLRMPEKGNTQPDCILGQFDVENKHTVVETRKGPITIWWSERGPTY